MKESSVGTSGPKITLKDGNSRNRSFFSVLKSYMGSRSQA